MTPSSTPLYLSYSALERVTTLIQYLATHANQEGVTSLMTGRQLPINGLDEQKTSAAWEQIAQSSGFFEVFQGQQNKILRLRERHNQGHSRPPLTAERITALKDEALSHAGIATTQSGHQLERTNMWVSAITGVAGTVIGSLVTYLLTGK